MSTCCESRALVHRLSEAVELRIRTMERQAVADLRAAACQPDLWDVRVPRARDLLRRHDLAMELQSLTLTAVVEHLAKTEN